MEKLGRRRLEPSVIVRRLKPCLPNTCSMRQTLLDAPKSRPAFDDGHQFRSITPAGVIYSITSAAMGYYLSPLPVIITTVRFV
jgi:hypothetical protein